MIFTAFRKYLSFLSKKCKFVKQKSLKYTNYV